MLISVECCEFPPFLIEWLQVMSANCNYEWQTTIEMYWSCHTVFVDFPRQPGNQTTGAATRSYSKHFLFVIVMFLFVLP